MQRSLPRLFITSLALLVLTPSASAQSHFTQVAASASRSATTITPKAIPPQQWVNQNECDGQALITKKVCTLGDSQCPGAPGDYVATPKGLNQAIVDAENLRARTGQGTLLIITAGTDVHIVNPVQTIVAKNFGYLGNHCIVFQSSNPLPPGVRVGSVEISSIQRDQTSGLVTAVTTVNHGLQSGDVVEIKNVSGWTTNFNGTFPVSVLDAFTFTYPQAGASELGTVTPMLTVVTGPNTL